MLNAWQESERPQQIGCAGVHSRWCCGNKCLPCLSTCTYGERGLARHGRLATRVSTWGRRRLTGECYNSERRGYRVLHDVTRPVSLRTRRGAPPAGRSDATDDDGGAHQSDLPRTVTLAACLENCGIVSGPNLYLTHGRGASCRGLRHCAKNPHPSGSLLANRL